MRASGCYYWQQLARKDIPSITRPGRKQAARHDSFARLIILAGDILSILARCVSNVGQFLQVD